jgi:hypothetical protein
MQTRGWLQGALRSQKIGLAVLFALFVAMSSGFLNAQSSSGTITGLVVDENNAIVQGAKVMITASDGTVNKVSSTDSGGLYSVPAIPPGVYDVVIDAKGFKQSRLSQVNVSVGGITQADAKLAVGSVTETVTVSSQGELLTTSSATIQTTIDQSVAIDLPFPERTALGAVMLAPGVTGDPEQPDGVGSEIPSAYTGAIAPGAGLSVGGSRDGTTSQLVDSSDITGVSYPRAGVSFSADAIRSVSVLSIGLPAQYGRSGAGIISQATAGGTDRYHGALRWRHRDPFFELTPRNSGGAPPAEHMNLFTVAVGGPVPLPFHKGRTFFFAAFEPLRYTNKSWQELRVLTPDEQAGRMINSYEEINTTILKNQGYAAAIAAPRTGGVFYQFPTNAQGFPIGNRYASSSQYVHVPNDDVSAQAAQNPITKYIFGTQPTPSNPSQYLRFNHPDASYDPNGLNAYGVRGVITDDNRYTFRIDENLTDRDRIFFRYTNVPLTGTRYDFHGPDSPLGQIPAEFVKSENIAINYVRTISQNKVNELRATYLRTNDTTGPVPAALSKDFGAALGLPKAVLGAGMPGFEQSGNLPAIGSTNLLGANVSENYGFGDDFSMVIGRHALKFGADYRAMQWNTNPTTNLYGGLFGNSGNTSGSIGTQAYSGSGIPAYMLGLFGNYTVNTPKAYYYRWKYGAAYVQDDWRALPRLTINVGMRYNVETPRMEKYNYQGSFVPYGTGLLNGVAATGGFAFSGTNGLPKTLWPMNYLGFEPRVGFAYQPLNFMTVRAAYTLMHAPLTGLGVNIVPNLTSGTTAIGNNGTGGTNPSAWVNLITNPISPVAPAAAPAITNNLVEAFGTGYLPQINQSKSVPYLQLWSLSLQFQLSKGTRVEADYVGQKGTHLYSTPVPTNDPPINAILDAIESNKNFTTTSIDPWGNTTNVLEKLRPYPQFNSNPIWSAFDRYADSNYHALYLSGQQRAAFGLTLFGNFAWSKSLDDASGALGGPNDVAFDTYGVGHPQGYSIKGDYSLSLFDIPVHVSTGYVWSLPIGRKQKYLGNISRWEDALVGGWSTSGILTMQSGAPWFVYAGSAGTSAGFFCSTSAPGAAPCNNGTALNDVYLRPNVVPGVPLIKKNWKSDPNGNTTSGGYLNPAAFSIPGSLGNPQFGNAPRTLGNARGPRTIFWNASLRKQFQIVPGRASLQLWTDIVNLPNHTNYFTAGTTTPQRGVFTTMLPDGSGFTQNPTFGVLTGDSAPRTINLGVALVF